MLRTKLTAIAITAFTSIPVSGAFFSANATPASSPFNIAVMAYRGQIKGIPGYDQLHMNVMQNNIKAADIIKAAGYEPTEELERGVRGFIHSFSQDD